MSAAPEIRGSYLMALRLQGWSANRFPLISLRDIILSMRTIVDIPEAALSRLDALAKAQKVSRAELVRRAVEEFANKDHSLDRYFGVWRDWPVDAVDYQRAIRSEWDRDGSE